MDLARVAFGPVPWSLNRAMRPVVALSCVYEAVAIIQGNVASRPLPTLTHASHHARGHRSLLVVWFGVGWLAYHVLFEKSGAVRLA